MDAFRMAAHGSRARRFDRRRWADSEETVPARTPDAGSRTRTRLMTRHVVSGLAVDKPADPTPEERARMLALIAPQPPDTRRPARVFTSSDMPVLPAEATAAQVQAWTAEYRHRAHARGKELRNANLDPYDSPMGDGPAVKLVRTANGVQPV